MTAAHLLSVVVIASVVAVEVCMHLSQDNESEIVYDRFFSRPAPHRGGFFVEAGALDGKRYSNSWFFEKCLGWCGLLIEGNPANFRDLVTNRPSAIKLHTALCADGEEVDFIAGGGATAGAVAAMDRKFLDRWHHTTTPQIVRVPCITLAHALCLHGITEIDFLSLDVEGSELDVVRHIDFTRVRIRVIIVEQDRYNMTKVLEVRRLLQEQGYSLDRLAIRRSDLFYKEPSTVRIPCRPCRSYSFSE